MELHDQGKGVESHTRQSDAVWFAPTKKDVTIDYVDPDGSGRLHDSPGSLTLPVKKTKTESDIWVLYNSNVRVDIPDETVGILRKKPNSSGRIQKDIGAGVVDAGYTGTVGMVFFGEGCLPEAVNLSIYRSVAGILRTSLSTHDEEEPEMYHSLGCLKLTTTRNQHAADGGLDLYFAASPGVSKIFVKPGCSVTLGVGIGHETCKLMSQIETDKNSSAMVTVSIMGRSGLAFREGVHIEGPAHIEPTALPTAKVEVHNMGHKGFILSNGMRIAQLVPTMGMIEKVSFNRCSDITSVADRGQDGFGSTGVV